MFFHSLLSASRSRNMISRLEVDGGEMINDRESIVKEVMGFFERLYTRDDLPSWGNDGVERSPISLEERCRLERPFEEEEVRRRRSLEKGTRRRVQMGLQLH